MSSSSSASLSFREKLIYGFGDTGFSLTSTILDAFFAIFLTDVVGVQPGYAAIALFIGRSWDYINDPILGHLSDRTRTRWGRRRPFLLFGALPFAIAFTMLWFRPAWDSQLALVIYYAIAYLLFDTTATLLYMPYFALTPELTDRYDERTTLTTYRMFFSILGSLVAFTVPMMIIGSLVPENAPQVLRMGGIFAAVSAAPMLLVFFNIRERREFMTQAPPKLRDSLKSAWKNRPFVFGAVIYLFTWVSMSIVQTALLYYIKYVIVREGSSDILMAAIFVTAIIALPLWERVSRKAGKRRAYIYGVAFWAVVQILLVSLTATAGLGWIIFLCILAGIGVSAAHVLPWSILPDAVEWDEYQTGERHEGVFYSLVTLMQKIASSIAIPLILLVLQVTGYEPNAAVQSGAALWGIRIVMGPIPALLLLGGILFALRYPLGREQFTQVVSELEKRRALKEGEAG
jgi:GPH family glycoside/pentoside/hexuronide:cation symporter